MSKVHLPIQLNLNILAKDHDRIHDIEVGSSSNATSSVQPSLWGIPLKYLSWAVLKKSKWPVFANLNYRLVTLAIQNSALTIIMHYSRVYVPPSRRYSAATAVLMNEILKGAISLVIAFIRIDSYEVAQAPLPSGQNPYSHTYFLRLRKLWKDVWSSDCWKLSIPAILYGKFYVSWTPKIF